jgi:hypothetical protein
LKKLTVIVTEGEHEPTSLCLCRRKDDGRRSDSVSALSQ